MSFLFQNLTTNFQVQFLIYIYGFVSKPCMCQHAMYCVHVNWFLRYDFADIPFAALQLRVRTQIEDVLSCSVLNIGIGSMIVHKSS